MKCNYLYLIPIIIISLVCIIIYQHYKETGEYLENNSLDISTYAHLNLYDKREEIAKIINNNLKIMLPDRCISIYKDRKVKIGSIWGKKVVIIPDTDKTVIINIFKYLDIKDLEVINRCLKDMGFNDITFIQVRRFN